MFRRFLALLFAVAMAAAPLGMPAMAEAAPAAASHHGMAAGQPGHCDQRQAEPDRRQPSAPDQNCCAAMCIAVVIPLGAAELASYHPARARPASDLDRRGVLAEIATPPPRTA